MSLAVPSPGAVTTEVVLDRARELVAARRLDDATLRRWVHGLPGVDEVGADARAAALSTSSIKAASKAWALDLAVRMVDLTTLEGADTPGTVRTTANFKDAWNNNNENLCNYIDEDKFNKEIGPLLEKSESVQEFVNILKQILK